MFSKAYLKLAGFYLLIIMTISLLFSINLYFVSVGELARGAGRQGEVIESFLGRPRPPEERRLQQQRQATLDEARSRVVGRLVVVNAIIFVSAGALSYYLARRSLQPIEEAHRSLERFTADASHELRTPITAMQSEIEVTLSDPKLTLKAAKAQLRSNLEELAKLTSLSDGLLRLAQLDNSAMFDQQIEITEVLADAASRVQAMADIKHISLIVPEKPLVTIPGDAASLTEGFVTLLDNAIKYSPEKSTVTIALSRQRHMVQVRVIDEGIGILATELPHVFDRFYRADTSRTRNETHGYGLGLAIAKNVFELHHGSISVASTPSKGTTFTVRLPR